MQRSARLLWCVSALIFFEGILFTFLGPLLPTLKAELDLSTSEAGLLAAAYVSGVVIAAAPVALASARLGVKTCTVTGVALMAGGTFAFGVCDTFAALLVSQFVAGVGCAGLWIGAGPWMLGASPSGERGGVIGAALGITAAGQVIGPVVGGIAVSLGRSGTFTVLAVLMLLLCLAVASVAAPPRGARSLGVRGAAASPGVRVAVLLFAVPSIVWGAVLVLGTLQMADLGASPGAIATVFVIAAAIGAVQAPLVGRWSDRRGRLVPIRLGLLMCTAVLVGLSWAENRWAVALLMISSFIAFRFMVAPSVALLSDACHNAGGGDVLALALSLPVASAGIAVGSAGGGALAQAAGSSWTYNALAAGVLAVFLALRKQSTYVDLPTFSRV